LGERLATAFPELEKKMVEDWVLQIARGYENHQQVFQRILDTFLNNHRATVIMYWILFLVGIGLFVTAAVLGVVLEDFVPAAIFGGLGVVSFLSFFVGRSLQSVEENLEYITWLGIIYNTYWTRQAWTLKQEGAQDIIKDATNEALAQLEHMIDKHANARRLRPQIKDEE
jgi:fatty acid desaturase